MTESLRPRSWWLTIAVILLVIAGFFSLLSATTPVQSVSDLAAISGTVANITRENDGTLVLTLGRDQPALRILTEDQRFLDEAAFQEHVRPGERVTALVIAARLREGASPLTIFGFDGPQARILPPEPVIAERRQNALVLLPVIVLALSSAAAGAFWLGFHDMRRQRELLASPTMFARYKVGTATFVVTGVLCLLVFSGFTLLAWRNQALRPALFFLAFAALGLLLLTLAGTIEIDDQGISVRSSLGRQYIAWSEVDEVTHDRGLRQLVFRGADKQLVIHGPRLWSGPHRLVFYRYLAAQLKDRAIRTYDSDKAILARSRNTSVERQ